jgi:hypothetical protein
MQFIVFFTTCLLALLATPSSAQSLGVFALDDCGKTSGPLAVFDLKVCTELSGWYVKDFSHVMSTYSKSDPSAMALAFFAAAPDAADPCVKDNVVAATDICAPGKCCSVLLRFKNADGKEENVLSMQQSGQPDPSKSPEITPNPKTDKGKGGGGTSAGTIAGAVIGAIIGVIALVGAVVYMRQRSAAASKRNYTAF